MTEPVLSVRGLTTVLHLPVGRSRSSRDVDFDVRPGETVALVGESGCGKSMTMLSVMGLHPQPPAEIVAGQVLLDGRDLLTMDEDERRAVRGAAAGDGLPGPDDVAQPADAGRRADRRGAASPTAERGAKREAADRRGARRGRHPAAAPGRRGPIPHEFSGGMRQRVVIAMALALRPKVLIADEPTTALDVTIQQQIIALVGRSRSRWRWRVVWVTHDLGVVARVAERTMVMYGGHIVEDGPTARGVRPTRASRTPRACWRRSRRCKGAERHPLRQIPGAPPDPGRAPAGCPFTPRCPNAVEQCRSEMPPLTDRAGSRAACWVPPLTPSG